MEDLDKKQEIRVSIKNRDGQVFEIVYRDIEDIKEIEGKNIIGVYSYCFYGDKLVIVNENGYVGNPGGGLEEGESVVDGLFREIQEETNMRVIKYKPIGIHETIRPTGESVFYVRFVCMVEPIGDFKKDPAGDVMSIDTIEPNDFIKYCESQWGAVAEKMMDRAMSIKADFDK